MPETARARAPRRTRNGEVVVSLDTDDVAIANYSFSLENEVPRCRFLGQNGRWNVLRCEVHQYWYSSDQQSAERDRFDIDLCYCVPCWEVCCCLHKLYLQPPNHPTLMNIAQKQMSRQIISWQSGRYLYMIQSCCLHSSLIYIQLTIRISRKGYVCALSHSWLVLRR